MSKKSFSLVLFLLILAMLFALTAFKGANDHPRFNPSPLIGLSQQQIAQYAVNYSKHEFKVKTEPFALKVVNLTGEDLQHVGVRAWGKETEFVFVAVQGDFDTSIKWPRSKGQYFFLGYVFDPISGLAAFKTTSPENINTLAGEALAPPLPPSNIPIEGPAAVPDNSPIEPDSSADDLVP